MDEPLFAVWTGLEPATSGVTGRHSNQLNYQTGLLKQCKSIKNILFVICFVKKIKIFLGKPAGLKIERQGPAHLSSIQLYERESPVKMPGLG